MINPVEYLRMVHTAISTVVVPANGAFSIAPNANRIGLSISMDSGNSLGFVFPVTPDGTAQGLYGSNNVTPGGGGIANDTCFSWLLHGTLPQLGFSAQGFTAAANVTVVELVLRQCDTDVIAKG